MMTLKEIREAYEELSGKLSDVNRQLCFAGIALIWIFNTTDKGVSLPKELYLPLLLFVISLGLDILQYFISTIVWYLYYLCKRPKNTINDKSKSEEDISVDEPECLNIIPWVALFVKAIVLFVAYVLIGLFLIDS